MILNNDIWTSIISYLPKTGAYNRVDADLWIRISLICKCFQQLAYSEVQTFNSKLKWDKTKSLRWNIDEINRENTKLMKIVFRYVHNPDAHPEKHAIADCSPFFKNYYGESLIDIVISNRTSCRYVESSEPTLKLLLSHMSIEELKKYFPKFINRDTSRNEYAQLLNYVFESFVEKTNESDTKKFFQIHLGKEMYKPVSYYEKEPIYNWLISKGMVLNIECLFYYFSYGCNHRADNIREVLQVEGLDPIASNGDRVIHALLKGPMHHETLRPNLELIFECLPSEIKAKDNAGKSAISYIFNAPACRTYNKRSQQMEYNYILLTNKIFTPNLLWELREECFQTLLEYIKKDNRKVLQNRSTQPDAFLVTILGLFPDKDDWVKWLNEPFGEEKKCLGDELSIWCPPLMEVVRDEMHYQWCFEIDDELSDLVSSLKKVSNCSSEDFKLMVKYPGLEESIRLEIFRNLFVSEFDNNFEEMNKVFGPEWFRYKDAEGNTLLHYLLSQEAPDYIQGKVAETIDYMIGNGLYLNRDERRSLIDLAKVNGWDCVLSMLK